MSIDEPRIIYIEGHAWEVVNVNQTQSRQIFKLEDVIKNHGHKPNFASSDI